MNPNSPPYDSGAPYVSPTVQRANPNAYWSPGTATYIAPTAGAQSTATPPGAMPRSQSGTVLDELLQDEGPAMNLGAAEFVPSRGGTPAPPGEEHEEAAATGYEDVAGGGGGEGYGGPGHYEEDGEAFGVAHGGYEEGGAADPASVDWTEGTAHAASGLKATMRLLSDDVHTAQPSSAAAPPRGSGGVGGSSLQMSPKLRLHLHAQALDLLRQLGPGDERYKEIPPRYHSAFPLDHPAKARGASGSYGYPSAVFKVASEGDGVAYALRRIDNARVSAKQCAQAVQPWAQAPNSSPQASSGPLHPLGEQAVRHPSLVSLERCFVHQRALFFLHAYWPTAQTLAERYVNSRAAVPEALVWSYLVQLGSCVRLVHQRGLALRCVSAQHVLVTSGSRVRIGGAGVVHVLEADQVKSLAELQLEDVLGLGQAVLTVASRVLATAQTVHHCLEAAAQQ